MMKYITNIFNYLTNWKIFGIVYLIAFLSLFKFYGVLSEGFYHAEFWLIPIYVTIVYKSSIMEGDTNTHFLRIMQLILLFSLVKTYYFLRFTLKPFDLQNDCAIMFFMIIFAYFWAPISKAKLDNFIAKLTEAESEEA